MPSLTRDSSSNSSKNAKPASSSSHDQEPSTDYSTVHSSSVDQPEDDNKFKQLLTVLKKAIGVKDMGMMRLSLPANLITPIGNLEYWSYLDRPDFFAAINDSDDDFERMLAVLRWTLTKDCKFIHGPICKPYNSVLGEQFRCIFDVVPSKINPETREPIVYETATQSVNAEDESLPTGSQATSRNTTTLESDDPGSLPNSDQSHSTLATTVNTKPSGLTRVVFLNEQVSHHPPISCFWYEARPVLDDQPSNSSKPLLIAHGVDQISAKFTGTSVKVFPGPLNKGIYVKLPNRNEEYEITHPTATITGLIRASPYAVITDCTYITCRSPRKRNFRTIINYLDESWVGKARFALEGVIYELKETDDPSEWSKIKQVPADRIWCKFSGSWRGLVTYTLTENSKRSDQSQECESKTTEQAMPLKLIDMATLQPLPKTVRPEAKQTEMESRKFWKSLTSLIQAKNYAEATKLKQTIEQDQRDLANQRKSSKQDFKPVIFQIDDHDQPNQSQADSSFLEAQDGYSKFSKPRLTKEGVKILEAEFAGIGYEDVKT